MDELLDAIAARITADSGVSAAFAGGYRRDQAPPGTAMPYLVSRVLSSRRLAAYGAAALAVTQIQFCAYGVGHDATAAAMAALLSCLDDVVLTLGSGSNFAVRRLAEPCPRLREPDGDGLEVWEWAVTYEYVTE